MKYIAKSGEPPHPKASSDGCHVSCLGLSWNTEEDTLALGFIKDFFLKRFKKHLPPPDLNLSEPAARNEAMARNLLTRALRSLQLVGTSEGPDEVGSPTVQRP